MEAFNFESGKAKGVEVLFFEEAEIQKMRGTTPVFAAMGSLSVLYFKDYNRFVLQLNDWRYPLLRRLNISGSENSFVLPGNNSTFNLRILSNATQETLKNFETILMNNSRFGGKTLETSPDDKLARKTPKEATATDKVAETAKNIVEAIKAKTAKSSKKRSNLKDIKNKDFQKDASSSFNKDFFESYRKITNKFLSKRRENPNMSSAVEFTDLVKTSDSKVPTHFIYKSDLEESIISNKEIVLTN